MGFTINSSTSRWITKWRTAAPPWKRQIVADDETHADDDRKSIIYQETFERYWEIWRCKPPHCLHQLLDMWGLGCKRLQRSNCLNKKCHGEDHGSVARLEWCFLFKEMSRKDPTKNPQLNLNLLTVFVGLFHVHPGPLNRNILWHEYMFNSIWINPNIHKSEVLIGSSWEGSSCPPLFLYRNWRQMVDTH